MQCWRGASLVAQARQVAQQARSCLPVSKLPYTAIPQTQKQLLLLAICIECKYHIANTFKYSWLDRDSIVLDAVCK